VWYPGRGFVRLLVWSFLGSMAGGWEGCRRRELGRLGNDACWTRILFERLLGMLARGKPGSLCWQVRGGDEGV